jgi:hypothetical protein
MKLNGELIKLCFFPNNEGTIIKMNDKIIVKYPDDDNVIIEVIELKLGDDDMLVVDYNITYTDPKGIIDDDSIGKYMEQWLKELVENSVKHAKKIVDLSSNT